jgi:hypothetical protein
MLRIGWISQTQTTGMKYRVVVSAGRELDFAVPPSMFARTVLRARPSQVGSSRIHKHVTFQRRQISILEPLASGIIETGHIISSLPLPASIPPYSCAIIGITLALRVGITLPMALWVSLLNCLTPAAYWCQE